MTRYRIVAPGIDFGFVVPLAGSSIVADALSTRRLGAPTGMMSTEAMSFAAFGSFWVRKSTVAVLVIVEPPVPGSTDYVLLLLGYRVNYKLGYCVDRLLGYSAEMGMAI